ncbi:25725_t:CDS:2, partial [Gigaspora rosea]
FLILYCITSAVLQVLQTQCLTCICTMQSSQNEGTNFNVEDTLPVQLFIEGVHRSSSILAVSKSRPTRINLSLQARDKVIAAHRAHHSTGVEIVVKILAPHNNANEAGLEPINKTSKDSYELVTNKLKALGKVLYYQRPDILASEN